MSLENMPSTLWHYTTWDRLPHIVESGKLQTTNAGASHVKPLLWFSANQGFEPTALKMARLSNGQVIQLSFRQQLENFGCVRFGLSGGFENCLNWRDACRYDGTSNAERRAMESYGRKIGGNPVHWFAVMEDISIDDLALEVWLDGGWHSVDHPRAVANLWKDLNGRIALADILPSRATSRMVSVGA